MEGTRSAVPLSGTSTGNARQKNVLFHYSLQGPHASFAANFPYSALRIRRYTAKKSATHSFLSLLSHIWQYQAYGGPARTVAEQNDPVSLPVDQLYPLIYII